MPLPHIDPSQLQNALVQLEHASSAATDFAHRARQQAGTAAVLQWKRDVGTGPPSLVFCRYVLDRSSDLNAVFHASSLIGIASTRCVLEGHITPDEAWSVWRWMRDYALERTNVPPQYRFLPTRVMGLLSSLTKAGWALPAVGPPGRTGWTHSQRSEIRSSIVELLAPSDGTDRSRSRLDLGFKLTAALANDFSTLDDSGDLKPFASDRTRLSWAQEIHAQKDFEAHVLPHLLQATLAALVPALESQDFGLLGKGFECLQSLLAWRSEDLASQDPSLPESFDGGLAADPRSTSGPSASSSEGPSSRPMTLSPSPFAPCCVDFLNNHLLEVIYRAYTSLWSLVVERPTDSSTDGESAAEGALTSCEACIVLLLRVSVAGRPAVEQTTWRSSVLRLLQLLLEKLHALADPTLRFGAIFTDRLSFFAHTLRVSNALVEPLDLLSAWAGGAAPEQGLRTLLGALALVGDAASQMMVLPASTGAEAALEDADTFDQEAAKVFEEVAGVMVDLRDGIVALPGGHQYAGLLGGAAAQIAIGFIVAKLQSSRTRSRLADAENDEYAEDQDVAIGIQDKTTYADLLLALAQLSRIDVWPVLNHLHGVLGSLSAEILNLVHRAPHPADALDDVVHRSWDLHAACEAIHWAILITGSVLADSGEGETPMVPEVISTMSQGLATSGRVADDPTVAIPHALLHLLRGTTMAPTDPAMERCSPQVAETLIWFFGRWALSYLLADPEASGPTSPTMSSQFGGDGGRHLLEDLMRELARNLVQWPGELAVLEQLAESLTAIGRSGTLSKQVVCCGGFADMVRDVVQGGDRLPEDVVGSLVCGIMRCVSASLPVHQGREHWSSIVLAVERRLGSLVASAPNPQIVPRISSTLDMYIGLAGSIQPLTSLEAFSLAGKSASDLRRLWNAYAGKEGAVEIGVWKVYAALVDAIGQGLVDVTHPVVQATISEIGLLAGDFRRQFAGYSVHSRDVTESELRTELGVLCATLASLCDACQNDSTLQLRSSSAAAALTHAIIPVVARFPGWLSIPSLGKVALKALSKSLTLFASPVCELDLGTAEVMARQTQIVLELGTKNATNEVVEASLTAIRGLSTALVVWPSADGSPFSAALDRLTLQVVRSLLVLPVSKPLIVPLITTLFALLRSRGSHPALHALLNSEPIVVVDQGGGAGLSGPSSSVVMATAASQEGHEGAEAKAREGLARLWETMQSSATATPTPTADNHEGTANGFFGNGARQRRGRGTGPELAPQALAGALAVIREARSQ